jgi:hypothetical protein
VIFFQRKSQNIKNSAGQPAGVVYWSGRASEAAESDRSNRTAHPIPHSHPIPSPSASLFHFVSIHTPTRSSRARGLWKDPASRERTHATFGGHLDGRNLQVWKTKRTHGGLLIFGDFVSCYPETEHELPAFGCTTCFFLKKTRFCNIPP